MFNSKCGKKCSKASKEKCWILGQIDEDTRVNAKEKKQLIDTVWYLMQTKLTTTTKKAIYITFI